LVYLTYVALCNQVQPWGPFKWLLQFSIFLAISLSVILAQIYYSWSYWNWW
jgi:hypothetical protein